jgi:hypothetical protein
MRLPRFSIGLLLAVIALCGVAVSALRTPSYLWANALYTAAAVSVVVASIQAAFGRGGRRAFWAGFLMAAGSYLVTYSVPNLRESVCPKLLTEPLLDMVYPLIAPPATPVGTTVAVAGGSSMPGAAMDAYGSMMMMGGPLTPPAPAPASRWAAWTQADRSTGVGYQIGTIALASPEPFRQTGHSIMILLGGAAAGTYARRVRERGQEVSP